MTNTNRAKPPSIFSVKPDETPLGALRAWLDSHHARCHWDARTPGGTRELSAWGVDAGVVIVEVFADRAGNACWNMYTAPNTNNIAETFADAEARLRPGQG